MGVGGVDFTGAVWGSDEIKKILKKEEKKGESKVASAISNYHLAHAKVKDTIAQALTQETGMKIEPGSEMVENAVNALSLTKIFESKGDIEQIVPGLKQKLQKYEVDSKEAHVAIADELSKGSKQKVPDHEKVVQYDLDVISMKTIDDPNLLF